MQISAPARSFSLVNTLVDSVQHALVAVVSPTSALPDFAASWINTASVLSTQDEQTVQEETVEQQPVSEQKYIKESVLLEDTDLTACESLCRGGLDEGLVMSEESKCSDETLLDIRESPYCS